MSASAKGQTGKEVRHLGRVRPPCYGASKHASREIAISYKFLYYAPAPLPADPAAVAWSRFCCFSDSIMLRVVSSLKSRLR